jgi:signal transduction histidine kinase/putative methionine-R-sulfoxide reductase with GAF domain
MRQFADSIGLLVGRKAATQQLLLDVIGSADDPNAIVKAIQRHLQPAAVSIFLRRDGAPDKFRDRIFLSATTFKPLASRLSVEGEDIKRMSYSAGEGLTGWVYKTGKVLHISDVLDKDSYPRYPYFPKWNHKIKEINNWVEMRAFLGVPIRSDNRVIGVIRAARLKKDPGFRNDEVELLTGIASIVGAAASKARLYKEHGEKIRALKQAQDLLEKLTEPGTSLDSITKNMVGQLGHTYVTKGKWEAVYVVQHLKSSKQFRIVAYFPSDLADKYRRSPFLDTEGVVGHVLKTGKFSASKNFIRDGVKPTTPWTSVICAPIFHKGEMWGAVDLCGNNLSQTDVDLASPRITRFAENMSIVCRLSEMLDAKNAVTLLASNVLSLNLEAHEVYKSLESSKITVDHLCTQVEGEEKRIAEDLAKQIDDSLSWADVCLDLGRYIRLCQTKPDTAIEAFRDKHLLRKNGEKQDNVIEHPWEEISITEVAKRALSNMQLQVDTLKTDMRPRIMDGGIIVGDENLLYRAFRNLLENAMVHGSKIPGKLGRFKKGLKVFFSIKRDNNTGTTKIVIQDRGVGMNPMILAASKEIYANPTLLGRTSFAPGFGTTIVAFALSVHHGCILLESRHGKGTKVTIEIPSCKKRDKPNEKDNYHR